MSNLKILFIPVETISRELDTKLILASEIVDSETICFLGQHNVIDQISNFYKNGVYVGKNIFKTRFPTNMSIYRNYKKNEHTILWLHEEGGIYYGDEHDWQKTLNDLLDAKVLEEDDQILTWGEFQKNHYEKQANTTVKSVGSPRFNFTSQSLLRKLVQKFNRVKLRNFVLINTNFSIANYILHQDHLFKILFHGPDNKYAQHNKVKRYAQSKRCFSHFIEAISELAFKYPDEKFVIRPHPTESTKIYENLFFMHKNVIISKEFSAVEWIDRCKVLIQNGCTTSVEAYLMGKKVLNYYPFNADKLIQVTREIGTNCSTLEDLEKGIFEGEDNFNAGDKNLSALNKLLDNTNQDYDEGMLVGIIKEALQKKEKIHYSYLFPILKIYLYLFTLKFTNLLKKYPRLLFFPKKQNEFLSAIDHYPGMKKSDVLNKVNFISEELQKKIDVNFFSKDLILLSKSKEEV